jgi:hypothetical protein
MARGKQRHKIYALISRDSKSDRSRCLLRIMSSQQTTVLLYAFGQTCTCGRAAYHDAVFPKRLVLQSNQYYN